jgi:putative toxin-antitoxin system antitoxin component (TIGR02293 family)
MASVQTRIDDAEDAPGLGQLLEQLHEGPAGAHHYAALLGLRSHDLPALLRSVEKGFRFTALEHLRRNVALSSEELEQVLGIPSRTLARRKSEGRFHPEESDRMLRAARIYSRVIEVFEGDARAATDWLTTPQMALGSLQPLELVRTELGAREVEALLDRLEQGVYS